VSAALTGAGFSLAQLYEVAKQIQDELYVIPAVKRVDLYGVQSETVWIEFSTARIAQLGFSVAAIRDALVSENVILPGGSIDTGQRELIVMPHGDFQDVEDIESVPIEIPDTGQVIQLQDVASVRRGYVDPPTAPFYYDGEQAVLIGVSMAEGENVLSVGPRIVERLEQLEQLLPIGFRLRIGNYQPTHVERAVAAVRSNLFQTIAIVLVVIVGFLGLRTGAIVGLHVPLTMIVTLCVMYYMEVALHRISLATLIISLGLLVDNGIVVAEEIGKRLFQGEERLDAAANTGRTLSTPLLISSVTTVLMFVPLAMAPHAAGEYLRSMSQVILISLGVSWLLAMTVTPILCNRFLKAPQVSEEEVRAQYERPLFVVYRRTLESLLRQRALFLAAMLGFLLLGVWLFSLVPKQFMPQSDRPQILVDVKLPAGYGIRESDRRIRELVAWLEDETQNPEVVQTLTYVGSGGVRFFVTIAPEPAAANMGFVLVTVNSDKEVGPVMQRLRHHARQHFPALDLLVKRMFLGSVETGLVEARISALGLVGQRDKLLDAGDEVAAVRRHPAHDQRVQGLREPRDPGGGRDRSEPRTARRRDQRRDRPVAPIRARGRLHHGAARGRRGDSDPRAGRGGRASVRRPPVYRERILAAHRRRRAADPDRVAAPGEHLRRDHAARPRPHHHGAGRQPDPHGDRAGASDRAADRRHRLGAGAGLSLGVGR
jgi:multidrug efflux pump subunit AcrB